jgi:hypothetical protein
MKKRKFAEGSKVEVKDEDIPSKPGPGKKPLPSEIKKEDKAPVDKYIKEPFRKANDAASKFFESKGLTNPVDVIDEELGGETIEEARARRKGMPVSKSKPSNFKSGGSVSSASKRADGCAIRGKTRA